MKNLRNGALVAAPLILLLVALLVLTSVPTHAVSEPVPGTVQNTATYQYLSRVITNGVTVYSPVPLAAGNLDASVIDVWNSADVFMNAALGSGAAVTVTPQLSADCSNYASARFDTVISGTVQSIGYQLVGTSAGTQYMRMPLAGRCMRFAVASTGTVTVSVFATLKNN